MLTHSRQALEIADVISVSWILGGNNLGNRIEGLDRISVPGEVDQYDVGGRSGVVQGFSRQPGLDIQQKRCVKKRCSVRTLRDIIRILRAVT